MPHLQHVVNEAAKGHAAAATHGRQMQGNSRHMARGSVAHRSAPERNVRLTNQTKAGVGLHSWFGILPHDSRFEDFGGYPPGPVGGYPPGPAGGYPPRGPGGYPPRGTGGYPPVTPIVVGNDLL